MVRNGKATVTSALVLLVASLLLSCSLAKNVHVTIRASWSETPLIAEACESIAATKGSAGFFACLESANVGRKKLIDDDVSTDGSVKAPVSFHNPQSQYEAALSLIQTLLANDASGAAIARAELAGRVHSPRVEAHRELYRLAGLPLSSRLPVFITADGSIFGNAAEAIAAATSIPCSNPINTTVAMEYSDLDHVFPASSALACRLVLVYGDVTAGSDLLTAHHKLVEAMPSIRYVFRHAAVVQDESELTSNVPLQGYGVTLDVKNMEYKAVDEKTSGSAEERKKAGKKTAGGSGSAADASTMEAADEKIGGFDIARLKQRRPSLKVGLSDFASELSERLGQASEEVKLDLQVWELQHLGLQAALHVLKSANPASTLLDLLNNFPLRAGKVSALRFPSNAFKSLQQQLMPVHRSFGPGNNALFLNGRSITTEKFDYYSILAELQKENAFLHDLENVMFFSGAKNSTIPLPSDYEVNHYLDRVKTCQLTKAERREKGKRFWVDSTKVMWLNDLTTDPAFYDAPKSVRSLMQMNAYGQPVFPRRNVFHAIYVVDPSQRDGLEAIAAVYRMIRQGSAARIGLALIDRNFSAYASNEELMFASSFSVDGTVQTEGGVRIPTASVSAAIQAVVHALGSDSMQVLEFLMTLHQSATREDIPMETVVAMAAGFLDSSTSIDSILSSADFFREFRQTNQYFMDLGIRNVPVLLFNGIMFHENLHQAFYHGFQQDFQMVRELIMRQQLDDSVDDIYTFLMNLHGAVKRYQPAIYENVQYVPLKRHSQVQLLETQPFMHGFTYDGTQSALVTHVLILPSPLTFEALTAVERSMEHLAQCTDCPGVQLTLASCSKSGESNARFDDVSRVILGTFALASADKKLDIAGQLDVVRRLVVLIRTFLTDVVPAKELRSAAIVGDIGDAVMQHLKAAEDSITFHVRQSLFNVDVIPAAPITDFCADTIGDNPQQPFGERPVLLTNGRRIVFDGNFIADDLFTLEMDEAKRTQNVFNCIEALDFSSLLGATLNATEVTDRNLVSSKLAAINSLLFYDQTTRGQRTEKMYLPYTTTPYAFQMKSSSRESRFTMSAVIDPVSRESQHLASLVKFFSEVDGLDISSTIFLNPTLEMQKVPIHNFYQFVAQHHLEFDSRGLIVPPGAYFRNVPQSQVLTLGLVDPEAWLVFATYAQQDLDNIRLDTLHSGTLKAEYTLRSILLTGSCHDLTTNDRPRGLPVVMSKNKHQLSGAGTTDTLVMSNYGYFQLQGTPAVWHLAVQPGIASSIFEVVGVQEKDASTLWQSYYRAPKADAEDLSKKGSKPVAITSFTGKHVNFIVRKQEGKEHLDILESLKGDADDVSGNWPPVITGPQPQKPSKPTLNVFSVASGHLYERFLRMMFHTVMQSSSDVHGVNTTRIKFWLIENFLSPKFKATVPKMAAHYGFDYGFVTYRWPHWLRRQTEKQRTIWGYKILFLDVLFPLDVEKVIFVDADQVVRADLHELYNMDLNGRAVAYTPFCRQNRNEETKGFRFWDQGFWADHLQGRPYHISAIYVVDLKRLRQMAAGDQYRMIYENLSADPNSLANLDQDLPNFAQHQVPIHSLPEEWLWCETWCNAESKSAAKTIDLCNNPLTKTPKLENAKRIIPEWEATDAMLEQFEHIES